MSVHIGEDCEIHPTAIIHNHTWIGDDVYIGPYAIIGAPPQHHGSYPIPLNGHKHYKGVSIGSGSCIREFCTVHAGIKTTTSIGRHTLLMAYTHIGHDSDVGNQVTICTSSLLGGFTQVDDDATLGQGVVTHPWVIIGHGSMVGLNSSIVGDVLPYQKVAGSPARLIGANTHKAPEMLEWHTDRLSAEDWERWRGAEEWRRHMRKAWDR